MSNINYFIIFGKNGSIGKSLKSSLAFKGENAISISWALTKTIINSDKSLAYILKNEYQITSEKFNIILINCLKEKKDYKSSLKLNKKLLSEVDELGGKVKYIYFSTYEPNIFTGTEYRKIKFKMEKFILGNNGVVIRIGYYISQTDVKYKSHNYNSSITLSFKNSPILVPVTKTEDLLNTLKKIVYDRKKSQLYHCYSGLYGINLVPKLPFIILKQLDVKNKKLLFNFPFEKIAKILYSFSKFLRHLKFNGLLISFLEKPYSLFLQQSIIENKK